MLKLNGQDFTVRPFTDTTYAAWLGYVTQLAKDTDNPVARFLARHCEGLGPEQRREALAAWMSRPGWDAPEEEAIAAASTSRLGICALATYCLLPPPSWEEALTIVTEENKAEIKRALQAVTAIERGEAHGNRGEYDKAIAQFTGAIRLDPALASAHYYRGATYLRTGEHDKAIADFTQAIRLDPKYALAYCGRGEAYWCKGESDASIVFSPQCWQNLAFCSGYLRESRLTSCPLRQTRPTPYCPIARSPSG
jgi:tetratricopeptide (TPR) repeat protein